MIFVLLHTSLHKSSELKLKKVNDIKTKDSFLDPCINIKENRFSIGLWEKRYDVLYSIVKMLYLLSNIPSKVF